MSSRWSAIQIARRVSLGFFLLAVTVFTVLHLRMAGFPSIDGICPFGGIETLYSFVAGGELLKNIQPGSVVLMLSVAILGVVLSRFFCGWICAFGALQGIFGWIGKKLFRRRFNLPSRIDHVLRYLKYVILVLILIFTWQAGALIIRTFDPWVAYGHITAPWAELWGEFALGLIILVASLVLSIFSDRVFCKYVCPLGAVNALLSRVPLLRIKRNKVTCTSCTLCSRACPMNIPVDTLDKVDSAECIACFECVTGCPASKGTLVTTWAGRAVKVGWLVLAGLAIYFLTIGTSHFFGMDKFGPVNLEAEARAGTLKVEDITGQATWLEIGKMFNVDVLEFQRACGIDPAKVPAETKLKESALLSGNPEFSPDLAKTVLAGMLGVEYAGEREKTVKTESVQPAEKNSISDAAPEKKALYVPADFNLEGTMTITEIAAVLEANPSDIIEKLELPKDIPVDKALRDLKTLYNFSMPDMKARIHE